MSKNEHIQIPKTSDYGWHWRRVSTRLRYVDGFALEWKQVFDPSTKEMENRIRFCKEQIKR